tara:strand:- start:571 stop:1557 length:987 start_codon:yes stop_codon:yes gene_type:complete
MAFLDRSSLIIDAVLTDKGREALANNDFAITKFGLSDDEVDYTLYNEANSGGPNFYGIQIESMPIHEAFLSSNNTMLHKLITRPVDVQQLPDISPDTPSEVELAGENNYTVIEPDTTNFEEGEEFIFELENDSVADLVLGDFGAAIAGQDEPGTTTVYNLTFTVKNSEGVELSPTQVNNIFGLTMDGLYPLTQWREKDTEPGENPDVVTINNVERSGLFQQGVSYLPGTQGINPTTETPFVSRMFVDYGNVSFPVLDDEGVEYVGYDSEGIDIQELLETDPAAYTMIVNSDAVICLELDTTNTSTNSFSGNGNDNQVIIPFGDGSLYG